MALKSSKKMKVYVILYQDWLNSCKVSQEGYKTLSEAQAFCEKRLGMDVRPDNSAIFVEDTGDKFIYSNAFTAEKFTIVEVSI